jgi:hypothetical protein
MLLISHIKKVSTKISLGKERRPGRTEFHQISYYLDLGGVLALAAHVLKLDRGAQTKLSKYSLWGEIIHKVTYTQVSR